MSSGIVFYAVLNMGLGHASRSLPVISGFVDRGWWVIVGANGRALAFLRNELPQLSFVETPDYALRYSSGIFLPLALLAQTPRFFSGIGAEKRLAEEVVRQHHPDLIISDHCYGISHPDIPSHFLSHQIYFAMPPGMEWLAPLPAQINFHYHADFDKVIIPDLPGEGGGALSGRLSRLPRHAAKYHYAGLLSSVRRRDEDQDLDVLVSISGPEPQRTHLENIVLAQIKAVPGRKVVLLGKSESRQPVREDEDLKIYPHLPRAEMARLMNRAALIVSRPGYSTLMELAEIGKPALLIPTPGQTEQVYLARRLQRRGLFYAVSQNKLNLGRDIPRALDCPGLNYPDATQTTVKRLLDEIIPG